MPGNGSPARDVAQRAREVIGVLVADGRAAPDIQHVADAMETSVRTLQRRLQASGLTYAGVLQETRLAAACGLLEDQRLRIGAIARTLGYSDPGHFTRAFQRWTGVTPRDFRHRGGRTGRVHARSRRH